MKLEPSQFSSSDHLSVGIISDTHGLLRSEAISALSEVEVILHGGDVGEEAILARLEEIAPVFTVRGNVDYEPWCGRLPTVLYLTLGELKILMIHDISHMKRTATGLVDLVVYGHSHQPKVFEEDGVVFLNPGSAGPRRFTLPVSVARLNWEKGMKKISPQLIRLL